MNLEASTVNVLLVSIIALQAWMVRELMRIRSALVRQATLFNSLECQRVKGKVEPECGIALAVLAAVLALPLTGCGTAGGLFKRTQTVTQEVARIAPQTNTVLIVTNTVQVVGQQTITNWVTNLVNIISPGVSVTNLFTNTVYTISPAVERTLTTCQTLNENLNPTAFAAPIDLVLGGLAAVLGFVAKLKSDKARLLPAVIAGVEAAGNNVEVKQSISRVATAAGLEERLRAEVKKVT